MIVHMVGTWLPFAEEARYGATYLDVNEKCTLAAYLLFGNKHVASLSNGALCRSLPSSSVIKPLMAGLAMF
jgi:hypothetical protein